jgi:hypothetical protein
LRKQAVGQRVADGMKLDRRYGRDPGLAREGADDWMALARRGDWDAAWALNDAVLARRDPATRDDPMLPYHLRWVWDGRPFAGQDVLVRCYHGLGDTLQFARFLPDLRRRARSLTVEAQPPLVPLLSAIPGVDRVVPFVLDRPLPPAACDLEVMELGHALRMRPEASGLPALAVTPVSIGAKIGVCCASGGWDPGRDMPPLLMASVVRAIGRVVALQPAPAELPVINPEGCPASVLETAQWIAGLDLVITVDTMVAHLAGSLGVPTWLLLRHDADWRWMSGRTESPWYPTMRLFRQASPGDWCGVIRAVKAALVSAGLSRSA